MSEHKQQTVYTPVLFLSRPRILSYDRTQISLTCLFNLRLPGLGGGHDGCGGLRDAPGRLLQSVQIGAVFIRFNLETKSRTVQSHSVSHYCSLSGPRQVNDCCGRALTFEAATSCAVLAAISCEHTINSSNFPLPCTTMSAASLQGHASVKYIWLGVGVGLKIQKTTTFTKRHWGGADAYTMTVAPQPTALEAEIRPSVQREFLA